MSILKIGKVTSIDYEKGSVVVVLEDQDNLVSDPLPLLSFSYEMPKVNDLVACIFLGQDGICLGKYFNETNLPVSTGESIWYKNLFDQGGISYNSDTKTLTIKTDKILVEGDLTVIGKVDIQGNLDVTGTITGTIV